MPDKDYFTHFQNFSVNQSRASLSLTLSLNFRQNFWSMAIRINPACHTYRRANNKEHSPAESLVPIALTCGNAMQADNRLSLQQIAIAKSKKFPIYSCIYIYTYWDCPAIKIRENKNECNWLKNIINKRAILWKMYNIRLIFLYI